MLYQATSGLETGVSDVVEIGQRRLKMLRAFYAHKAIGRDPNSLEMSMFEKSIPDQKVLADMEEVGVKRISITIFGLDRDESLPLLDKLAKVND